MERRANQRARRSEHPPICLSPHPWELHRIQPHSCLNPIAAQRAIMNFAPYQDESPEVERALSPPPLADPSHNRSNSKSPAQNHHNQAHQPAPPPYQQAAASTGGYGYQQQDQSPASWTAGFGNTTDPERQQHHYQGYGGRADLDAFETSLPLRVDYEAMLAYLLLPPAGGVILLLLEHKSDYVRYDEKHLCLFFYRRERAQAWRRHG
jgi:hypothetical protein